jgi:hypothetical protein
MSTNGTKTARAAESALPVLDGERLNKSDEDHLKQNEWKFDILRARQRNRGQEAGSDLVRRKPEGS